jgi:translation initiation factor 3 subunit D
VADNSFKVTKWLVQSLLAEVDLIKFAFVTRKMPSNNTLHQVLATHTVKTKLWANELGIQLERLWPIVKHVVEHIERNEVIKEKDDENQDGDRNGEEDEEEISAGEYVLLKDFNKLEFRLYKKVEEEKEEGEEEKVE